jgi:hypothetical protein
MNQLKAIYYIWDYFDSWILLWSRVGKSIPNFRELDVSPPLGGKVWGSLARAVLIAAERTTYEVQ